MKLTDPQTLLMLVAVGVAFWQWQKSNNTVIIEEGWDGGDEGALV